ncbi:MAG: trigger factor, partial [Bacteroidota bacterium]
MQVSLQKKNDTEATISVKVTPEDYQAQVAQKIREHSKKAQLKGFRPGNIPATVIKRMYGQAILQEVIEKLVKEALTNYIQQEALVLVGELVPRELEDIDWATQSDFSFDYGIGMAGPFSYTLSEALCVKGYKIDGVSDKAVDDWITRLRYRHGESIRVDKSEQGDAVEGTLRCAAQGFESFQVIYTDKLNPKAQQYFVGVQEQQTITFNAKEVFDAYSEAYIGDEELQKIMRADEQVEFTVAEIRREMPAALDQSFFDAVFPRASISTEAAFRQRLSEKILQAKQVEADIKLDAAIKEALLDQTAIALPDDFLKQWITQKLAISQEALEKRYPNDAQEVRWSALKRRLRQDFDGLAVTSDDVVTAAMEIFVSPSAGAEALSESAEKEMAQNFLQQIGSAGYQRLYEQVSDQKVFDLVK